MSATRAGGSHRAADLASRWIGVDVGATHVRVRAVRLAEVPDPRNGAARLVASAFGPRLVARFAPFTPLPLAQQRAAAERGLEPADLAQGERAAAHARAALVAELVHELVRERACEPGAHPAAADAPQPGWRVAMCAPGLRADGDRGLVVCANGPRAPHWNALVADALATRGVRGVHLAPLVGDGFAAAVGEARGVGGALDDGADGLVVVPGSGLAEGWLRAGRAVPDRERAQCFEPAWSERAPSSRQENEDATGHADETWEQRLSLAGLNRRSGAHEDAPEPSARIEQRARGGDRAAQRMLQAWSTDLGRWLGLRAARARALGTPLARAVLGGASASWIAADDLGQALAPWVAEPLTRELAGFPLVPATADAALIGAAAHAATPPNPAPPKAATPPAD